MLGRYDAASLKLKGMQGVAVSDIVEVSAAALSSDQARGMIHVDHWFAFAFQRFNSGSTQAYDWLAGPLYDLQCAQEQLLLQNANAAIYRHFAIPHPRYLHNPVQLDNYRNLIVSVLHIQLTMGVTVIAHFVDPTAFEVRMANETLDVIMLPTERKGVRYPGFHTDGFDGARVCSGSELANRISAMRKTLRVHESVRTLTYYEEHYLPARLDKTMPSAWRRLRAFFWDLGAPEHACFHCHCQISRAAQMDLDHLVPFHCRGTHILTNLRPAHQECNRSRQDDEYNSVIGFAPGTGVLSAAVINRYGCLYRPPWLGSARRPAPQSRELRDALSYNWP